MVIVSGPSGVGKGTVIEQLKKTRSDFVLSVSTTTRKPRPEGSVGEHYSFVGKEEFSQLVSEGAFLEWAEVHGNFYGTRKAWVEEKVREGWIVILEIDVQGALQVMGRKVDNASVFEPLQIGKSPMRDSGRGALKAPRRSSGGFGTRNGNTPR